MSDPVAGDRRPDGRPRAAAVAFSTPSRSARARRVAGRGRRVGQRQDDARARDPRFARPGLRISAGSVRVRGGELLGLPERELRTSAAGWSPTCRRIRRRRSTRRCGSARNRRDRCAARRSERDADDARASRARPRRTAVGPPFRRRFPHQLSGGQQQRVAIAMALSATRRSWCSTSRRPGSTSSRRRASSTEVSRLQRGARGRARLRLPRPRRRRRRRRPRPVMYAGRRRRGGPRGDVLSRPAASRTRGASLERARPP